MAIEIEAETSHPRVEVQVTHGDKKANGQACAPANGGERRVVNAPETPIEIPDQEDGKEAAAGATIQKALEVEHAREDCAEENTTCKRRKVSIEAEATPAGTTEATAPDMSIQPAENPVAAGTGEDEDMNDASTCVIPATTPPPAAIDEVMEKAEQEEKPAENSVSEADNKAEPVKSTPEEVAEMNDDKKEKTVDNSASEEECKESCKSTSKNAPENESEEKAVGTSSSEANGKSEPAKANPEGVSDTKNDNQIEACEASPSEVNGKTDTAETVPEEISDIKGEKKENAGVEELISGNGQTATEKEIESTNVPIVADATTEQGTEELPPTGEKKAPESTGEPAPEAKSEENDTAPILENKSDQASEKGPSQPVEDDRCCRQAEIQSQHVEKGEFATTVSAETTEV